MRKKIALIGGGQIGQNLAMLAAQKELGDIVILDIPELENPAKGKALDLMEMAPHGNYDANITGTSDYKDIAGADVVIDTSETNVHELRDRLVELFAGRKPAGELETSIVSFGFKHGLPLEADLVFDARFLPNPHWIDALRPHNGLDEDVREYVMSSPEAVEFLERIGDLAAFLLPYYAREGKSYVSIAIGCTGGRHRSVVLAEALAARLRARDFAPEVHHRDLNR